MQTAALRAALEALHTRALSHHELELVVRTFHGLALAYLGRKASAGRIETGRLGLSLDDLAVDCIAELFGRDDQGRFGTLISYFPPSDLRSLAEFALIGQCRRLVFSAVNQQLFRIYGAFDPAFRKLLRNLKGAAGREPGVQLAEHQGETWLVFSANGGRLDGRPVLPPELMEILLPRHLSARSTSVEMLRAVETVVSENRAYARGYPLIGVASVLRRLITQMEPADEPDREGGITLEEIDGVIRHALHSVGTEIGERYVRDGKIPRRALESYHAAVREILLMEFGDGNGHDVSFYDILSTVMPGISPEEYAATHRSRLEYIVRVSRRRFLEKVQEIL